MQIGFYQFVINPPFPVNRMLSPDMKHQAVYDDLHCRILVIKTKQQEIYHLSIDTVELYQDYRNAIKNVIEKYAGHPVEVITSATHSHFCPCLTTDEKYRQFLLDQIAANLSCIEMHDYENVTYTFTSEYFDKTGCSRISAQPSEHIYAQTLSLYGDGKRIGTILLYNSHATTMPMKHGDFTAEYPGYVIERLRREYPGEFFTFMLGPAGDISCRFTRKNQEYEEIMRLGEMLADEYRRQLQCSKKIEGTLEPVYTEYDLPMHYELPDIDSFILPDHLSQREFDMINEARESHRMTEDDLLLQPKTTTIGCLRLSDSFCLIFEPFEMFSSYYQYINREKCALVTISNGFGHYVAGLDEKYLSMEVFGDIVSKETKRDIAKLFQCWSNGLPYSKNKDGEQ